MAKIKHSNFLDTVDEWENSKKDLKELHYKAKQLSGPGLQFLDNHRKLINNDSSISAAKIKASYL